LFEAAPRRRAKSNLLRHVVVMMMVVMVVVVVVVVVVMVMVMVMVMHRVGVGGRNSEAGDQGRGGKQFLNHY
jgi:heme/copper-type cytochrome/quinol oxidase subunit 2